MYNVEDWVEVEPEDVHNYEGYSCSMFSASGKVRLCFGSTHCTTLSGSNGSWTGSDDVEKNKRPGKNDRARAKAKAERGMAFMPPTSDVNTGLAKSSGINAGLAQMADVSSHPPVANRKVRREHLQQRKPPAANTPEAPGPTGEQVAPPQPDQVDRTPHAAFSTYVGFVGPQRYSQYTCFCGPLPYTHPRFSWGTPLLSLFFGVSDFIVKCITPYQLIEELDGDLLTLPEYHTTISVSDVVTNKSQLVLPFLNPKDSFFKPLGFKSKTLRVVSAEQFDLLFKEVSGMRLNNYSVDSIRYKAVQLKLEGELLPRLVYQKLLQMKIEDNVSGTDTSVIPFGSLNCLAPESGILDCFVSTMYSKHLIWLTRTTVCLSVAIVGVVVLWKPVISVCVSTKRHIKHLSALTVPFLVLPSLTPGSLSPLLLAPWIKPPTGFSMTK